MRCGCLAKGKPRRECCCTLVPKDPEQQQMVRSSLRDGPGDPSCLVCGEGCGEAVDGEVLSVPLPREESPRVSGPALPAVMGL